MLFSIRGRGLMPAKVIGKRKAGEATVGILGTLMTSMRNAPYEPGKKGKCGK